MKSLTFFYHSFIAVATGNGYQERWEFTFTSSYIMQGKSRDNPSAFSMNSETLRVDGKNKNFLSPFSFCKT